MKDVFILVLSNVLYTLAEAERINGTCFTSKGDLEESLSISENVKLFETYDFIKALNDDSINSEEVYVALVYISN